MKKSALVAAALAVLATGARADLAIPYNQTAADSSEVNAAYNAKSFSNTETSTTLTSDGTALKVSVTWGHSAGKDYGANAGILQPLNNMWAPVDFSNVTAVKFDYMTDAKTTGEFAPASPLYLGDADNTGVMMLAELAAASSWKSKTIALPDGIAFLGWMTKDWPDLSTQTWDDVKTKIKCLQFAPKPNYASATALGLPATTSMSIKNLVVVGTIAAGGWLTPETNGKGCTGAAQLLADFNNATPKKNYQGGWWYGFTDTTSGTVGDANGSSALVVGDESVDGMTFLPGDGNEGGVSGYVGITANLNKKIGSVYHPYAGWADVGTGFKDANGDDGAVNLGTTFTAFSFDIVMGGDAGAFDETNLTGVDFKVGKTSVGDSVQWHIGVPYSMNNQNICVDASALVQPTWYTSKLASVPTFSAEDVSKLLWEIKIQNQDATLKATTPTSSLNQSFYVGNIRLWNIKNTIGISSRKIGGKSALVANYANGLVLSYALEGAASAKVDVVRMDGSKVASFDAPASASAKSFSMNLARGSYLAVVKGGKTSLVAPFAVAK